MAAKRVLILWATVFQMLAAPAALAHGDWKPKHGGVLNDGGETSFEVTVRAGRVVIYVSDHGEPVRTAGAKGTIEVTHQGKVVVADLLPAGRDQLRGKLSVMPSRSDAMMVRVVMENGSIAVGRFRPR